MDYLLCAILWVGFCVSIIYWDTHRYDSKIQLSECHSAEIKVYHERPMCTECKLYCEVK